MAIHFNPIHNSIATHTLAKAPAKSVPAEAFGAVLRGITTNKPAARTPATTSASTPAATPAAAPAAAAPGAAAPVVATSSDGTSLANLMAAASYAGVPYGDLGAIFNGGNGPVDPNWQQKMANALEQRLQSAAGSGAGASNQIYDPDPSNDSVTPSLTNTSQFFSSAATMQGLINNVWSTVHAGDVNGYHAALQSLDSFYKSNGQQNYQTGLTDAQVAGFNPANRSLAVEMPNANSAVAAAELAAITGKSSAQTNLAAVAQSALTGTIKT